MQASTSKGGFGGLVKLHHAVKTCEYEDVYSLWEIVKRYDKEMARSSSSCRRQQRWNMVANLRQRFFHSIEPGGLAGDRRAVVPASGFSFSAQQIWKIIKENKDLDLPAHKVKVATVRCEEIFNEKYAAFSANEEWCLTRDRSKSGKKKSVGREIVAACPTGLPIHVGTCTI